MFLIRRNSPPTLANHKKWSTEFVAFVDACLTKDPDARPSAEDLIKHPFVQNLKGVSVMKKLISQSIKEQKR